MNHVRRLTTATIISSLLLPASAAAQSLIRSGFPGCDFETGQLNASCAYSFLAEAIKFIFELTGGIAAIMIIVAGYQIALAKATGRDRSEGLTRLRVAVIGFILCGMSWYIIDFVVSAMAGI